MMDATAMQALLAFLREAEALKDTLRSGITSQGRQESTAEHTWRLCLMVMALRPHLPDVDCDKVLRMCLIHDLGEIDDGDVPAIHQNDGDDRKARERACVARLASTLGGAAGDEIIALWDEYEACKTGEAQVARGLDKLETMLQHTQGANAPDFDYVFNIGYGRDRTDAHPLVAELRVLIDAATQARAEGKPGWAIER